MSSTNRRSFLARSAALAVVPAVAALAGGTLTGQASAATRRRNRLARSGMAMARRPEHD
jgi:hypothetical protein